MLARGTRKFCQNVILFYHGHFTVCHFVCSSRIYFSELFRTLYVRARSLARSFRPLEKILLRCTSPPRLIFLREISLVALFDISTVSACSRQMKAPSTSSFKYVSILRYFRDTLKLAGDTFRRGERNKVHFLLDKMFCHVKKCII